MNRTATYLAKGNAIALQKSPCPTVKGSNGRWGAGHEACLCTGGGLCPLPLCLTQHFPPLRSPMCMYLSQRTRDLALPVPILLRISSFHRGTFSSSVAVRIKALSNNLKSNGGVSPTSPRGVQNVSMVQTMTVKGTGLQFGCI